MDRRLAAILATDVVGYSRLIREDEEGTIAALKSLRADLIDPKIAAHHGRISDCAIVSAEVSPAGVISLVWHCWGAAIELILPARVASIKFLARFERRPHICHKNRLSKIRNRYTA